MNETRGKIDLVGHRIIDIANLDPANLPPINNIIYTGSDEEYQWIKEATTKIGEWRAIFRSTYIRWSLTINGLFVAKKNTLTLTGYPKINSLYIHSE